MLVKTIPHINLVGGERVEILSRRRGLNGRAECERKKKLGRCPEEQRPNPESRKSHRSDPGDGNLHMYTLGLPIYIPKRG